MDTIEHKKGKIYYSMGEVAEMFDVNPATIRFWESKFDILRPGKNKKGNRLFTPKDVDDLKLVYHLVKEKGMTLAGAQKRIKENPDGISRDMEITDRLLKIRSLLLEIREELKTDDGEVYRDDEFDGEYAVAVKRTVAEVAPKIAAKTPAPRTPVTIEPVAADDADTLADMQAEQGWISGELSRLDELDENIAELSHDAGIPQAEADTLLEEKGKLAEIVADDAASWETSQKDVAITDEEFELLDDEHAPDYPADGLSGGLFDEPDTDAEPSLFSAAGNKPAEEAPKPRIIEQTLF